MGKVGRMVVPKIMTTGASSSATLPDNGGGNSTVVLRANFSDELVIAPMGFFEPGLFSLLHEAATQQSKLKAKAGASTSVFSSQTASLGALAPSSSTMTT